MVLAGGGGTGPPIVEDLTGGGAARVGERGGMSLRSVRARRSLRRLPMGRSDARGGGIGIEAMEDDVVDRLAQGQAEWQSLEWAGVS